MSLTHAMDCNSVDKAETTSSGVAVQDVSEQDSAAYVTYNRSHKTGVSHEEVVQTYSDWANSYDEELFLGLYNGPRIAANAMAAYYAPERRGAIKILDVAAGTGRVGYELHLLGFKNIDALEPSSGMLKVLIGRNIYGNTFETAIGFKVVDSISANAYDSLVIAGGMGEGHIPVTAVAEMIRVVKPGGTVFIVMREEYLASVKDYVDKLEPYMKSLQDQGFWKQISRVVVPEYSYHKNGVLYTFEVSSDSYPQ